MRTRALATGLALLLLAGLLLRESGPGASARPPDPARSPSPPSPEPVSTAPAVPARDVFRYVGEQEEPLREEIPSAPSVLSPAPPPLTPQPEESTGSEAAGPRLVGLVRQRGTLMAALWLNGELLLLKEGEGAGGYTVLSVDEDQGVRLQDAQGAVLTLSPPPF